MKFFYSQIAKIGLYQNGFMNTLSHSIFVYRKVMDAAFCLPDIYDFFVFTFNYYLRLYRMLLFFPE
jgi:hypothetical protein